MDEALMQYQEYYVRIVNAVVQRDDALYRVEDVERLVLEGPEDVKKQVTWNSMI